MPKVFRICRARLGDGTDERPELFPDRFDDDLVEFGSGIQYSVRALRQADAELRAAHAHAAGGATPPQPEPSYAPIDPYARDIERLRAAGSQMPAAQSFEETWKDERRQAVAAEYARIPQHDEEARRRQLLAER